MPVYIYTLLGISACQSLYSIADAGDAGGNDQSKKGTRPSTGAGQHCEGGGSDGGWHTCRLTRLETKGQRIEGGREGGSVFKAER